MDENKQMGKKIGKRFDISFDIDQWIVISIETHL